MKEVHLHISFSRQVVLCVGVAAMLLAGAPELDSESVTMTTYYPAPSGVYTRMVTTGDTYLARDGGIASKVGIGTVSPTSKLSVAGGIQLGDDPAACAGPKAGALRWHGANLELCDGVNPWRVAVSSIGALTQNNCYWTGFSDWSGPWNHCNAGYYAAGQQQTDCGNWHECDRLYCCRSY